MKAVVKVLVAELRLTLVTPWAAACQTPPSMESPGKKYWCGQPCPSPGELCDQKAELRLHRCQVFR